MKFKAYLYIIAAASLWGLIGLFVKILSAQGFSSMQIVALRSLASAVCITVVLCKLGKEYFRVCWQDLWLFIGTGILSLTFFNYCYFNCINASSLAAAALLLYTAPIFVMLMSLVLFHERFTITKGIALLTTFIGCALITGILNTAADFSFTALLYGLGSGIGYALYSIFGKFAVRKYSSATISAYTFYFSTLSSLPLADFSAENGQWNITTLMAALGIGGLCAVIPYLLYNRGLQEVEATQASILATVEPLVAACVGILCFSEPVTWQKLAGIALILASVIILNLHSKNVSRPDTNTGC